MPHRVLHVFAAILVMSALTGCEKPAEAPLAKSAPASSIPTAAPALAAIDKVTYRQHVKTLSSDAFGGRGPASEGERLTVEYLVNAFKAMGLMPGNGDSYTQDVPLAWVMVTNSPTLNFIGANKQKMALTYGDDQVVGTRRQTGVATIENSDVVFVGYGINAPERDWNDYAGVDVKGKTVIMLVNDPGYATQDPGIFNGNAMTYYGRWDYKYAEAARQGASAAIIIHDTKPAAYPWATVENSWTGRQFDRVMADADVDERLLDIQGWIQKEKARELFAQVDLDLEQLYVQAKTPGFTAIPVALKATIDLETSTEQILSQNVVAMLPGREAPQEYFIYMAHWDHLGTDTSLEGDQIYNGALDNATGTAGLLELASAYAGLDQAPRRSVMFLAVTAEEQGLLGSAYYASNPVKPLAMTVAGLNMDGLNISGPTNDVTISGFDLSELDDVIAAAAVEQQRVTVPESEPEKGYYYRSDHFELAKQGVPMLYPGSGYDHKTKGRAYMEARAADYIANDYHRVSDEYDPSWDVTGAMLDLQLYFTVGYKIADNDDWPNWREGTEFRAARDAQRRALAE
jgi:Zn-dependent M28 family amino/carboxypeptidase